ncbi:exporter of polyketide antibiotics [soil metagenome]
MTSAAEPAPAPAAAAAPAGRVQGGEREVAVRLTVRLTWRGVLIWTLLLAIVIAGTAAAYRTTFPTQADRVKIGEELGSTPAFNALFGPPVDLDTAGGFTAWRLGSFMGVLASLWALLTATRLCRGEEDEHRTDLLLSTPMRAATLLRTQLAVLCGGAAVIFVGCTLGGVAGDLGLRGSAVFAAGFAGCVAVFGALGAVVSQLLDTHRQAAGWTGAILGLSYLLRAVADSDPDRAWLAWTTPLGWSSRLAAFTGEPDLVPLVCFVVATAALSVVALELRSRRDTGAATWSRADRADIRLHPPRGTLGLVLRTARGGLIGWTLGLAFGGLVLGYLIVDVAQLSADNQQLQDVSEKVSSAGLSSVTSVTGFMFSFFIVVLAAFAGSSAVAGRGEESRGRIDHLLSRPVSRWRWLGERIVVMVVSVAIGTAAIGVATFLGVSVQGGGLGWNDTVRASLNLLPAAWLFGSLALAALALVPRATSAIAYGAVVAAYLLQLVGGFADLPQWLLDVSPFAHVAPVPAQPAQTTAAWVMIAICVALCAIALVTFRRRDLQEA